MQANDLSGKIVTEGDVVAYGHDNGSTLELGKVYKITPKKVWMYPIQDGVVQFLCKQCRDWRRVVKVENFYNRDK
ncbi:hypothetical protein EJP02_169 [Escherichia phage EJP2]|nr:hypothetical protein EJP02_169 [Escherichia phage EJP2]